MKNILEMRHITKSFPGIKANDDITLELRKSEVHAILGENGAGKSTLMSILFGIYQPDEGEIILRGETLQIKSPSQAYEHKIGMVHQHFKLVKNFTVVENIILGVEDTKRGMITIKNARKKIVELSTKYGLDINPDAYISDISVGMQQRIEILKILYRDAEILIFDEPTAVLTPQEIEELMSIILKLKNEGKSIMFISHKLDEIMKISDRVTVLKTGKHVGTVVTSETDKFKLSKMMVGRNIDFHIDLPKVDYQEKILSVKHLSYQVDKDIKKVLDDISFSVNAGEIVSIAGIDGNGQTELIYALTGLIDHAEGSIKIKDKEINHLSIRERTNSGLSHIPEDRHKHGLVLDYPLEFNLVLQEYYEDRFQEHGVLKFDHITKFSKQLIESFDIRSGKGPKTITRTMSGGNQQKAILAREISRSSDLLLAVQPTRGLDVGAIDYIHKEIVKERNKGKAVLVVSLELDEVMNISDRILVIYEGKIVGEFDPKKTTYEEIGLYMSGSKGVNHYES